MSDFTTVSFKGLEKTFEIPSVLAEFTLFGNEISIKFYGAIIAFGFTLAVLFGGRMAYKWKMSLDKMIDVLIYGTISAIIGARLYYVFSKWDNYSANPGDIIKIWEGGLAIYGGIIGGIAAAFVVCKVRKLNFWNLLDIAGMSLLIGQGIGRWGNFTNQEAFGVNTDMPWGMWSPKVHDYIVFNQSEFAANGFSVDPDKYVHPTFLYESIWCLLGVLVLYIITCKARKFSGQTFLCYGIWYGLERMIVEGLRTDSLYIAGTQIRTSQALSGAIVVVCTILLVVLLIKHTKNPKPIEGIDYFDADVIEKEKSAGETAAEIKDNENAKQDNAVAAEKRGVNMAKLIDGKAIREYNLDKIAAEVAALKEKGVEPALAVIIVGNDPASRVYVNNKKTACERVGMRSLEFAMPAETTTDELLALIDKLNADVTVSGILCQLPVPKHIDKNQVLRRILPEKDVDCFHPENVGLLSTGMGKLMPCTPMGMMKMLEYEGIDPAGKHCVIIGRSDIVGKPMAMLMLSKSATVTICHSKTVDLPSITRQADILVAAVGIPNFVTADMVGEGAIVLDVGINRLESGKLCGDVEFEAVKDKASMITPVPGGVGPMTIAMLMQNTLTACKEQNNI